MKMRNCDGLDDIICLLFSPFWLVRSPKKGLGLRTSQNGEKREGIFWGVVPRAALATLLAAAFERQGRPKAPPGRFAL